MWDPIKACRWTPWLLNDAGVQFFICKDGRAYSMKDMLKVTRTTNQFPKKNLKSWGSTLSRSELHPCLKIFYIKLIWIYIYDKNIYCDSGLFLLFFGIFVYARQKRLQERIIRKELIRDGKIIKSCGNTKPPGFQWFMGIASMAISFYHRTWSTLKWFRRERYHLHYESKSPGLCLPQCIEEWKIRLWANVSQVVCWKSLLKVRLWKKYASCRKEKEKGFAFMRTHGVWITGHFWWRIMVRSVWRRRYERKSGMEPDSSRRTIIHWPACLTDIHWLL